MSAASRDRTRYYDLISRLANTEESGGLAKDRAVLLLWFLRNVIGVGDLDAYEYVCDGDNDRGVDGLWLEQSVEGEPAETLIVFQSKYTEGPKSVGANDVKHLASTANHFRDSDSLAGLLAGKVELRLRQLVEDFDLARKLRPASIRAGKLRVRCVLVTTGHLTPDAGEAVKAANRVHGPGYMTVYDIDRLGPIAEATSSLGAATAVVTVPVDKSQLLLVGAKPRRVAVYPVPATEVVHWPGIEDRSLFELNVRRQLRPNRVSRQLDAAIRRQNDHKNFLSYHNGLTVVCDQLEVTDRELRAQGASVVNGAQSVVAFWKADSEGHLTPELRIFVKFVEVHGRPQLANEVSSRSNTQNPVNARMLMARSGVQARLTREFQRHYPNVAYETRPDFANPPTQDHVIANDEAAQLLCAIHRAQPWLAVKRLALFESENHAMIFETASAHDIVIADGIAQTIASERKAFPSEYRTSWKLTSLVAAYLVGQIARAADDEGWPVILDAPEKALQDEVALDTMLREMVKIAAATLKMRRLNAERNVDIDDYKKDFKNEAVLRDLAAEAQKYYVLRQTLG